MFTSSVCVLKLKVQFCTQREWFEECTQNLQCSISCRRGHCVLVASPLHSGISYYNGSEWFDPRNDLVLGGVRIGMGCMNLVTAISRSMWVPVTLITSWCTSWITHTNVSVYYLWCTSSIRGLPKPV